MHPLDRSLATADALLFVCSGNMVRSAFAELYARHIGIALELSSAATTYRNDRIFEETRRALAARGVPARDVRRFRPTHVDDLEEPSARTVVLAMTPEHLAALRAHPRLGPLGPRSFLLEQVVGGERAIADPVLEGADFGATFERVAACVDRLAERLRTPAS